MSYELRKKLQDQYNLGKLNTRIYGLPYTFTGITDPKARLYNKTIMDQISIVHIQPGQYDTDTYLSRTGAKIMNSIPFVGYEFDERVVKWGSSWLDYKNRYNALTSLVFNRMMTYDYGKNYKKMHSHDFLSNDAFGIKGTESDILAKWEKRLNDFKAKGANDLKLKKEGLALSTFRKNLKEAKDILNAAQKKFSGDAGAIVKKKMDVLKNSDNYKKLTTDAERKAAEAKIFKNELGANSDSSVLVKAMEKQSKEVEDRENEVYKAELKFMLEMVDVKNKRKMVDTYSNMTKKRRDKAISAGTHGMTYFLSPSSVNETISNNYSAGSFEGEANSHAQTNRDDADKIKRLGVIRAGIGAFSRQMQDAWTSFTGKFGVDSSVLNQGENVAYPKLWQNTDHNASRNLIMNFMTPYGDPYSVFDNIYAPLLSLMTFALPKQGGTVNSYKSPFIIRAETPGKFISEMGVIENINWTKGGNNSEWSKNMLPLSLEVTLSIQDLYPTLTAGASANEMNRNGAINLYISNMAGLMSYAGNEISGLDRINRIKSEYQFWTSKEGRDEFWVSMMTGGIGYFTGNS